MNEVLNREGIRKDILTLESKMRQHKDVIIGDSDKIPLKHSFADGVYVREIFIPKGTLIVGKIHKHSHPNFLMKGEVSVMTEEGPRRLKAPLSMISPAGTKRVVYAHEDTIWITIHVTKSKNLNKIEKQVIAKNYAELPNANKELLDFVTEASKEK